MKCKIKVTYPSPVNKNVDEKIREQLASVGAHWYAQGTDLTTGLRDMCFDIVCDHCEPKDDNE